MTVTGWLALIAVIAMAVTCVGFIARNVRLVNYAAVTTFTLLILMAASGLVEVWT